MNEEELNKKFGTEKQCREYLYKLRWPNGYRCPRCNCNEEWDINELKYKCKNCGYQTTITAGTLFHHTHIKLPLWFKAIWYFSSNPYKATATGMQKALGVSYKTAYKIFNKLQWAMLNHNEKLQGKVIWGTFSIDIENKRWYLILAGEIIDKSLKRIRFKCYESDEWNIFNDFYNNCINSENVKMSHLCVFTKDGIKYHSDLIGFKTYMFGMKYINNLLDIIKIIYIDENSPKKEINEALDSFCTCYNAKFSCLSFEEILKNAVNCDIKKYEINPKKHWKNHNESPKIQYLIYKR